MSVGGIPILICICILLPTALGSIFWEKWEGSLPGKVVFSWFLGQMFLWTVFQGLAVPFILREGRLTGLLLTLGLVLLPFLLLSLFLFIKRRKKDIKSAHPLQSMGKNERLMWWIFGIVLLVQIVLSLVMAYEDGDDSYFVAVASNAETSDYMFRVNAYTGFTSDLDVRHGLAPFSIYIAAIARLTHIPSVTVAHVLLPPVQLMLCYGLYGLLGATLFREKKQFVPLFLIVTQVLVIFGNYSPESPEKFLVTRIRQGKATLASLILPGIFFCLLLLFEQLQNNRRTSLWLWVLLFCVNGAGCLCSTMGALLCGMLVMIAGVVAAVMFRRWRFLIGLAICCAPCGLCGLAYLLLR